MQEASGSNVGAVVAAVAVVVRAMMTPILSRCLHEYLLLLTCAYVLLLSHQPCFDKKSGLAGKMGS